MHFSSSYQLFFLFLFRSVGRFENLGGGANSDPRLFEVGFASIQAKIWGGCPPVPHFPTVLFSRDDHDDHDAGVLSNI